MGVALTLAEHPKGPEAYLKNMVAILTHKGLTEEIVTFALEAVVGHVLFKRWLEKKDLDIEPLEINPSYILPVEKVQSVFEEINYRYLWLREIFKMIVPAALSPEVFDAELLDRLRRKGFNILNVPDDDQKYRIVLRVDFHQLEIYADE